MTYLSGHLSPGFMQPGPGRLLNFWTLRVGNYSRWALIKFSPFSAINVVFLFCNKTVNATHTPYSGKSLISTYSISISISSLTSLFKFDLSLILGTHSRLGAY